MFFVFLLLVALAIAPATASVPPPKARDHPSFAAVADQPGLPRVLLIGDSISMGYTLPVRELLAGRANVHRPPENCRSTRQTLERIEAYLGEGRWDVIHFNCGIHDVTSVGTQARGLRRSEGGKIQVPLDEYRRNLEQIVARLQRTGAKLVWASSTPVSPDNPFRLPDDIVAYNAAAAEIMARHGIAIDDLHAFATRELESGRVGWQDGVHFTGSGYRLLSRQVADSIESALARQKTTSPAGQK